MSSEHDELKQAVAACVAAGEELNATNLRVHLPPGFELEIIDEMTPPPSFPASEPTPFTPSASQEAAEPDVMTAPPPTLSVNDARAHLEEAQAATRIATDRQRDCRSRLAFALAEFQRATMQTSTFEELARQHIASENEQRRLRVEGKLPPRGGQRRLGSAVDSFAYHTRNMGRTAGGGRAFARKAFPASMRGRTIPKG